MREIDSVELAAPGPWAIAYDEAVLASANIDRFCSSSHWILPAQAAFHSQHTAFVATLDSGFVALSRGQTSGLGRYFAALEAMWGLACPLVGRDEAKLGAEAASLLLAQRHAWDVLWLGGIVRDGSLFRALVRGLGRHAELRVGPLTTRHEASLEGGYDGWLGRRSPLFRKRIRQAVRGVDRGGIRLEWIGAGAVVDGEALFERIHRVERRSWKGMEGTGFVQGDMYTFYRRMVPRLARAGKLRVLFASKDGEDIAFCFGGVLGDTYRGLQNSFDDRFRDLSLGNAMQANTIMRLAQEGVAVYDLGSEMEYKTRWADGGLETMTLIAVNR
jgi:hypothetical protein